MALFERSDKPDFAGKCEIAHVFDIYPKEQWPVKDTVFIPDVTARGYIIITVDHAQKKTRGKHAAESQAYIDAGAIVFWLPRSFVNPGKKSDEPGASYRFRQASLLFEWWPRIKWCAGTAKAGDLFDLDDRGKIRPRA